MDRGDEDRLRGLAAMAEASPDALVVVDGRGRIERVGGDPSRVLGWEAAQLKGGSLADVLEESSAARVLEELFRMAEQPAGVVAVVPRLQGVTSEGEGRVLEALLVALTGEEAAPPSALLTFRDDARSASERASAEQAHRMLEASNRDLEAFASIAAHDLQEPLRKIRAFADRIRSLPEGIPPAAADSLARIEAAAERMQSLITDLLTLSRFASQTPTLERVDLRRLVEGVVEEHAPGFTEAGARVVVEDLPEIEADPVRLQHLFSNLLSNALKFRREGTRGRIEVAGRVEDGEAVVTVRDDGIGFDPKYADRIFRPFERLHSRSEYGGTGMGLALCRAIVERHGGRISAEGEAGAGATFTIVLPVSHR